MNIGIAIAIVLLAAVISVVAASGTWVFWEAWRGSDKEVFRALLGGFTGAFFAFLFVRVGEGLKRVYERKEKHYDALVRLQHYFNDCLNTTADNIFIVDTFLSVFSDERIERGERSAFINRFHEYVVNGDLVVALVNLDFVNEVYSLNVGLRKMNDSLITIDRAYAQFLDAFIGKKISPEEYLLNVRNTRDRHAEVRKFLVQTKTDLTRCLATARLLCTDVPILINVIRILTRSKYPQNFPIRLDAEISKVQSEMDKIADESRNQIQSAQGADAKRPKKGSEGDN
jgi:hypothetical protein